MGEKIKKLEGVQAVVFDAYGTLFDVTSPVTKQAVSFGDKAEAVAALWRTKQLEYIWARSLIGVHADFWHVTREALDFTLESFAITEAGLADALMADYLKLDAFPETAEVLTALKAKGRRLAILSNGSPSMLDGLLRAAALEKSFEQVISVEDVGIYKPSRRVYRLAMQKFAIHDAPSICFVSANGWDAHSAAQFGFQVVRVKRKPAPDEKLPGKVSAVIESLSALTEML